MNEQATYTVRVLRLDPTLVELRIDFAGLPTDVEVRGRLTGPRCPGVSTVEIAYALKPLGTPPTTVYHVLIPEPSLWTPIKPYVYEGPAEFWRAGHKVGSMKLSISIKEPARSPGPGGLIS